jgi:hypothetical protein
LTFCCAVYGALPPAASVVVGRTVSGVDEGQ